MAELVGVEVGIRAAPEEYHNRAVRLLAGFVRFEERLVGCVGEVGVLVSVVEAHHH